MGTEVHYKNLCPRYYSMRDVTVDSSGSRWPPFYEHKALTNVHYYNDFIPKTVTDAYPGLDKDALKRKMLQHEAIFKNQVYELHRLYRRQRDIMEEVKRTEFRKHQNSIETSSTSSLFPSQKPDEDVDKWRVPRYPFTNSAPKKLFDLRLAADEYIDPEDRAHVQDNQASEISSCPHEKVRSLCTNEVKTFPKGGVNQDFRGSNGLADVKEAIARPSVDFFGPSDKVNRRDTLSYTREAVRSSSGMNFASQCFQDHFRFNEIPLAYAASQTSNSHPFSTSSYNGKSCSPLPPFWGKPNDSSTRKLTMHPSFLSSHSHEVSGEKWEKNGFYHASLSGLKEPYAHATLDGFDHRNWNKGGNFIDLMSGTKGADLNSVQTLSNEHDGPRKTEMVHGGIDINVAWIDGTVSEPTIKWIDMETHDADAGIKNHFDLNSCLTEEDEGLLVTESVKSPEKVEKMTGIDLEALPLAETEGEALASVAAEAIVALSNRQDHVGFEFSDNDECLLWFAEAIVSHGENMTSASHEIDEFELLTLQLEETKVDSSGPVETSPVSLPNQPRRGQARRGRAHRDFQRDILPGLVSLSRQEITEDLQVLGGLTRRNGTRTGSRGRRKVVETLPAASPPPPPPPLMKRLNGVEVVGPEERTLTGWGKTTRRPRRPRRAARNSVAVWLT